MASFFSNNIFNKYSNTFHNYKQTLLNCIVASEVIYYDDPLKKLQSNEFNEYNHTLEELAVSYTDEDSKDPFSLQVKYMISVNHGLKQIVVAFRGTKSFNDFLVDIKLNGKLNRCQGRFHSGIYHRSEEIPIAYFINKIKEGYQVVFTGHSLGAAVGALVAVRVLLHNSIWGHDSKKNKVLFIGFGSPAFADNHFKKYIEDIYKRNFHFYVNEKDTIVGALNELSNIIYSNETFQASKVIKELAIKLMDLILSNTQIGLVIDSFVELITQLSTAFAELIVPNYTHFGEMIFLNENKIERKDFSLNFDLKKYADSPDLLMNAIQNHYSGNYLRKIVLVLESSCRSSSNEPKNLNQLNIFNLPAELNEVEIDDEYKQENSYSIELVHTEFETDVFINIRCLNLEYITNGVFEVNSRLFNSSNSAKKVTFQYENDEKKSLQLSFSVPNVELLNLDNIEVTCLLDTHFEKRHELPIIIENKHFRREEFSHKEILIEDMPVDLLYIYAMNYINIFKDIDHERYNENCTALNSILKDICRIWKIDGRKKHELSNEELNGVLFSYFMNVANLDLNEQKFSDTFVNLTDRLCEKNTEKFIQDVLPTCYYLKQQQSSLITWDSTRSFFLNVHNSIIKIVTSPFVFKRITSDDGYLNTLKSIENVDFKGVLPYAGCYEDAIVRAARRNQVADSTILKSIKLNHKIRTILKDGFIFGVIGKKKCGKSTFIEKMLPGVNANADANIGIVKTGVYLTEPHSHVFFDYAHFDSVDFSHKLQFVFSRKLLNFIFMVCNAMERMDSDETMKLFEIIKGGHDCNYVILLNRADDILAGCIDESDYGKSTVDKLLRVVRYRCKLAIKEDKERVWLTCLKDLQNSNELDILNNVGVLFGDNLRRNVFIKVNQITGIDEEVNV